jgi:hypothetical protein
MWQRGKVGIAMAYSFTAGTWFTAGAWQTRARPRVTAASRRKVLERLERLSRILDTAIRVPGLGIRFGVDGIIGLAPGIGDAITTLLSCWIVYQAYRLGASREVLTRMAGNVALDGVIGVVPLFGDLFDVMWRANRRNVNLLRTHFEREGLI